MTQDIKFQGLSSSPSDNSVQDGELGACLNLIPEDGELRPIAKAKAAEREGFLSEGSEIVYVHKVTHNEEIHVHYIIRLIDPDDGLISWFWAERGDVGAYYPISGIPEDFKVNAVSGTGNILSLVGDADIWYVFWDSDKKIYTAFNKSKFKLSLKIKGEGHTDEACFKTLELESDVFWSIFEKKYTNLDKSENLTYPLRVKANKTIEVFNQLDALYNKRLDELGDNYFKYTTFLVAAVRLYDGSYLYLSPLCVLDVSRCSWGGSEETGREDPGVSGSSCLPWWGYWICRLDDAPYPAAEFKPNSQGLRGYTGFCRFWVQADMDVAGYEKIIDGIDIYVTKCESLLNLSDPVELGKPDIYSFIFKEIPIKFLQGQDLANQIDGLSFYKSLHITNQQLGQQFPVKRVSGTEESISLADAKFKNFGGKVTNNYNNRLHVGNITESVDQSALTLPYYKLTTDDQENLFPNNNVLLVYTDEDGKTVRFRLPNTDLTNHNAMLSIPIAGYVRLDVYTSSQNYEGVWKFCKRVFNLSQSDSMGYSYYINVNPTLGIREESLFGTEIDKEEFETAWNASSETSVTVGRSPNLIKVSEAENPLVFPASNSVQVGSSVIKAMAANTRPITEGQFGDAPLYVFTDEGIWMLMLSAEGKYQSRQPVNRDICSNPKGILQIDNAVLYPTKRGIMMQEGSQSKLITECLDGRAFDFMQLYKEEYSRKVLAVGNIPEAAIKYIPFREFMKGAGMVYDYYDARVIVFNPECAYAYVYSLKSGMWGTMESDIKKRIDIYPEAYAVTKDNAIVDLYQSQPTEDVRYFLCTRPMAISGAEVYKTMFSCITRGYFQNMKGKCGSVLYGSNDLFKWFPVKTSVDKYLRGMCGSPYKYFRLALVGSLSPGERLGGLSAEFQERWQNKLR